jgi:Hemerythrin HHE cation binding domain
VIDNLPERRTIGGDVDFTMMYAAHDAFSRQLDRIAAGLEQGVPARGHAVPRWALFAQQLHIHHTAEDESLWPMLRSAITSADELAVVEAMEAEHAQLDPQIARVDAQIAAGFDADAAVTVRELATGLARHMRHEENDALPLIEIRLGPAGWAAFGKHIRATQGISGASVYLPWLLDGAPADVSKRVLGMLPPPARLLYRAVWRRRYLARNDTRARSVPSTLTMNE